jgi:hypothetical protein
MGNQKADGARIPSEAIVVKTANSTYNLGPVDENGERDIVRVVGRALPYRRCKITFLAVGHEMIGTWVEDPSKGLHTTTVQSITVG